MQAGGRRFESDHLHQLGLSTEKKKQSALMVSFGTATPEVSPDDGGTLGLCQGESGSGASLGAAIA